MRCVYRDAEAAATTLASWADALDLSEDLGQRARSTFEKSFTHSHMITAYAHLFRQMHDSGPQA
jgi:glycosyltransferase involved in cell wall biosynthesis